MVISKNVNILASNGDAGDVDDDEEENKKEQRKAN